MNGATIFAILFLILVLYIFLLPTIVAFRRNHPHKVLIMLVNIFFGWSLIGWFIALFWAYSGQGAWVPFKQNTTQTVIVHVHQDGTKDTANETVAPK